MKSKEQIRKFREMKQPELVKELKEIRKDLTISSLKVKVGKLDNFSKISKLKKEIARIKTILNEKQHGVENEK